jgi:hypothetical protein
VPLLNIRISASERVKLKALAQTGGFNTLSAFVRHQLGLSTTAKIDGDAVPDKEVIDLDNILPLLVFQSDMLKEILRGVKRTAKSMGVDTEVVATTQDQIKHSQDGFVRG